MTRLIDADALKKAIEEVEDNYDGYEPNDLGKFMSKVDDLIDNAPTVLFPLTVKIKDDLTDEDKETLKRLMKDYKPQVLNLETERTQGEWIPVSERLPEYSGLYLISVDELVTVANFTGTYFMHRGGFVEVDAWRPLIEPYKKGDAE